MKIICFASSAINLVLYQKYIVSGQTAQITAAVCANKGNSLEKCFLLLLRFAVFFHGTCSLLSQVTLNKATFRPSIITSPFCAIGPVLAITGQ